MRMQRQQSQMSSGHKLMRSPKRRRTARRLKNYKYEDSTPSEEDDSDDHNRKSSGAGTLEGNQDQNLKVIGKVEQPEQQM